MKTLKCIAEISQWRKVIFDYKQYNSEIHKKIKLEKLFFKNIRISFLSELQKKGIIKKNYTETTFNFLIELTIAISILYFNTIKIENYNKKDYLKKVLKTIYPYLSDKGKLKYFKL